MDPGRWSRIKTLFDQAVDLPSADRAAFLHAHCDDEDIRRAVAELLDGDRKSEGFLGHETRPGGPSPPVFSQGQVVAGRFRIVRFHGRGGMGEVYEAYDERLRLRVGLKTIRRDGDPDPDALERFQREIRVAREVSHPNLCRVFDLLEHREPGGATVTCLTMEWLEGETLHEHLRRSRPWPLDKARAVLGQVAAALDALHRARIVHRDLKPGNIILVPEADGWRAVVTDFGLAKPVSGGQEWFESQTDAQAGAPYFMAPEQLRNLKPTAASDIFAFGLIIDEMVTRTRAFDAGSLGALYYQRLWEKPAAPRLRAPGLPQRWEDVILRCLDKDPAARYASAGEAVAALDAGAAAPMRSLRARVAGFASLPAGLVLAACMLLVVAVAFAWRSPRVETSLVLFQINYLADDPAYRHLSGGLTAELVSRLSRVEGLSVKQYYAPRDKAPLDAIRDRFHLDGDLQKYRNRIRLNMRLTDAGRGHAVVWSDSFDRDLNDPLELQVEVAGRVADGLARRVLADAGDTARLHYAGYSAVRSLGSWLGLAAQPETATRNPAAYHSYLRGRQLFEERSPAAIRSAVQSFEQAVRLDPAFALAWAALADAERGLIDTRQVPQDFVTVSRQHAEKAVALNPLLPEAHTSLAATRQMAWDWEGSESSYREAIRLDPKSPVAYRRYGGLILQFGRIDEALATVRKGLDLDPYDFPSHSAYGMCLVIARRYTEAEQHLKWTLAQRDLLSAHYWLGTVYALRGRQVQGEEAGRYFDAAIREAQTVLAWERKGQATSAGPAPMGNFLLALFEAMRGNQPAARDYLRLLESQSDMQQVSPVSLAQVYAALGDTATAVANLRRAADVRDRGLLYVKGLPLWDPLRSTPEFQQIMLTMRL